MAFGKKKAPIKEVKEEDYEEDINDVEEPEDGFGYDEPEEPNEPKKPKKEIKETWFIQDVPTRTQRVIVNRETKEGYDLYSVLVECLNTLEDFKKLTE